MNPIKTWIFLLAAMLAPGAWAAPATEGATPGEWTMDFEAAKALAAETGRPLLMGFNGSDWCGWGRQMERQVFSQEAWQTYAKDRLVLVWIDFPQDKSLVPEAYAERNAHLSREFEIGAFPTYVLLDADGHTRLGRAGIESGSTPESFIAALEDALLVSEKSVVALKENMTDAQKAAADEAKAAVDLARQQLSDWIGTDPEQTDENAALSLNLRDEIERAEATYLQLLKDAK